MEGCLISIHSKYGSLKYTGMTGSYERPGEKFRGICMAGGSPVPVPPLSHYSGLVIAMAGALYLLRGGGSDCGAI